MPKAALAASFLFLLTGCSGVQSALNAQGGSAESLRTLIFGIVGVCFVVWLLVVAVMTMALMRRRSDTVDNDEAQNRRLGLAVSSALAVTILILIGFTLASYLTTRSLGDGSADLTVDVRGRQWWWQFAYVDADPAKNFVSANELHIPVGTKVRLTLEGDDVIHSFWVPSLTGKQDMIPGRQNLLTIEANKTGVFRGQCAEFCGIQHSHMSFFVIVDSQEDFDRWKAVQASGAVEPQGAEAVAGKTIFMNKPCAGCHTIRGTQAAGKTGPDLTHVGSRRTIGAGVLETTRGSLAAWIADPQTVKPGNNMPNVPLTSDELRQVSAYMESLK